MPAASPEAKSEGAGPSRRFRYLPGLDGLRGLAILLVMLGHARVSWMGGGLYGVDIFFVLSGFLITSLLLQEYGDRGSIRLRDFYARRLIRLVPALAVMLAFIAGYVLLTAEGLRRDSELESILAAATYSSNWVSAFKGLPFLEPMLAQHAWSLAIEMQFYLVWPFVILGAVGVLRWRRKRPVTAREAAIAVGVAAAACWLLAVAARNGVYLLTMDYWRVYAGSDTRSDGLLLGCVLASVVRLGWTSRSRQWIGLLGLGLTLAIVAIGMPSNDFIVRWGFALVTLGAAALIYSVTSRQWVGSILAVPPLVYTGRISYSLYLWHVPIFLILYRSYPEAGAWRVAPVGFVISFAVGAASYHFVERPMLKVRARFERTEAGRGTMAAQAEEILLTDRTLDPAPQANK